MANWSQLAPNCGCHVHTVTSSEYALDAPVVKAAQPEAIEGSDSPRKPKSEADSRRAGCYWNANRSSSLRGGRSDRNSVLRPDEPAFRREAAEDLD